MSLEELEKELYGQKTKKAVRTTASSKKKKQFSSAVVQDPWAKSRSVQDASEDSSGFKKAQKAGKFLIFGLVGVLVILLGFAGYYLYEFFTTKDFTLDVSGPTRQMVGAPLTLSLAFQNPSTKRLDSPRVSLSLPEGVVFLEDSSRRVITCDVETIEPNQIIKEDFEVVIVGDSLKAYTFDASVSYGYAGSAFGSRFETKKEYKIIAQEPIISLDFSAPEGILGGQDFEVHTRYRNVGEDALENVQFEFDLPEGFVLHNSDPLFENNGFEITRLESDQEHIVVFSGTFIGDEYTYFDIGVRARVMFGGRYYDVNKKSNSVLISPSPLSIRVIPQIRDDIAYPGDMVSYRLEYKNNSDIALEDVIITARLEGNMFDASQVSSEGFFNSGNRSIVWTAASVPELKELAVNESGFVRFSARLLNGYPMFQLSDKDFEIGVSARIVSPTVPLGVSADETLGMAEARSKVGGRMTFGQSAYFDEPSSQVSNQGVLPPRLDVPIEYTIHWDLGAAGTDFEDVTLSAFLGPGVALTGVIVSDAEERPVYNARTQEVVWNLDRVSAGSGTLIDGPTAIFQVTVTPSANQVGREIVLISRTSVSAIDSFTDAPFGMDVRSLESGDLSDTFLPSGYDKVVN